MFTGIIQEIGYIERTETCKNGKRYLTIACSTLQSDLQIGESVSCNGICLTVTKFTLSNITVETMNQTMLITTANKWRIKTPIHLEKAMTLSGRLNGHIVQGHVDTTTSVIKSFRENNTLYIEFYLPTEHKHLVVDHGSICIDGVSLTVARLSDRSFHVALIEHTLSFTHFERLKSGGTVNLEFDIVGKYIHRQMSLSTATEKKGITEEWLRDKW